MASHDIPVQRVEAGGGHTTGGERCGMGYWCGAHEPYTLGLCPCTSHPTLYTLKPYTPNPRPQTLNLTI